jgi:hypothetical protein
MTLPELVRTCEEGVGVCEALKQSSPLSAAALVEVFNRLRAGFVQDMNTPKGKLEGRINELEERLHDLVTALVKTFGLPPPLSQVPDADLGPAAQFARAYWAAADAVPVAG